MWTKWTLGELLFFAESVVSLCNDLAHQQNNNRHHANRQRGGGLGEPVASGDQRDGVP